MVAENESFVAIALFFSVSNEKLPFLNNIANLQTCKINFLKMFLFAKNGDWPIF